MMKTSISHLSDEPQENLKSLVEHIREHVPETQFVILYGSYARGEQVEYDQRTEFGLRTCFRSDFDIVVLTPKKKAALTSIKRRLDNAADKYSKHRMEVLPPVHFLTMHVEDFNENIRDGRYFYTDIRKQGIVLFNSGEYEIEEIRELNYGQILKLAYEYFCEKYETAEDFLVAARALYNDKRYKRCAYMIQQAFEHFLLSIILSSSLYSGKEHKISELLKRAQMFTPVVSEIIDTDSKDDARLLKFLDDAYVQARYNKDFIVRKEDLDTLFKKLEKLSVDAHAACLEKIGEHRQRANA